MEAASGETLHSLPRPLAPAAECAVRQVLQHVEHQACHAPAHAPSSTPLCCLCICQLTSTPCACSTNSELSLCFPLQAGHAHTDNTALHYQVVNSSLAAPWVVAIATREQPMQYVDWQTLNEAINLDEHPSVVSTTGQLYVDIDGRGGA